MRAAQEGFRIWEADAALIESSPFFHKGGTQNTDDRSAVHGKQIVIEVEERSQRTVGLARPLAKKKFLRSSTHARRLRSSLALAPLFSVLL
jgi:hypothetical protein